MENRTKQALAALALAVATPAGACEIAAASAGRPTVPNDETAAAPAAQEKEEPGREAGGGHATTGHVISQDGTRIAFELAGDGPVLILVSGALSDRRSSASLAALLAPHFTVLTYDRRGRGESGDTPPYAVAREVEDLAALIDGAGGTACLFGSSSGAVLALEAASRLGAKVTRQVLHEPPFVVDASRPRVPADFVARVTELVAAGRRGDAVEWFMIHGVGVPAESVAGMRAMPMWAGMEELAHTLAYDGTLMGDTQAGQPLPAERWAASMAATLVLEGSASEPWLRAAARALTALLPGARQRTLQGQDHGVAFMAPQALVPVLVEFLAE